jgi:hypothetical protein
VYRSKQGNIVELVMINGDDIHVRSQGIISIVSKEDFEANYEEIKND